MSIPVIDCVGLRAAIEGEPPPKIIDVRDPEEFATAHIPGSENIPLDQLAGKFSALVAEAIIVFVCKTGQRSAQAASFCQSVGLDTARSLEGGLDQWSALRLSQRR